MGLLTAAKLLLKGSKSLGVIKEVKGGVIIARARADLEEDKERTYRGEVFVSDNAGAVVAEFWSEFRIAKEQS